MGIMEKEMETTEDYRDYIELFRDYEALLQGASPLKGCHARPSGWALR